jgi:hypothetical protein
MFSPSHRGAIRELRLVVARLHGIVGVHPELFPLDEEPVWGIFDRRENESICPVFIPGSLKMGIIVFVVPKGAAMLPESRLDVDRASDVLFASYGIEDLVYARAQGG